MSALSDLRRRLADLGVDGFVIPRGDRHLGEQVPPCDERLAHVTGFTGSAGLAIVLAEKAALFVDGRYEIQAGEQVAGRGIDVVFLRDQSPETWIAETLSTGQRLAYDPWLHPADQIEKLAKAAEKAGASWAALDANPIDPDWADRPARPTAPIVAHPLEFAGEDSKSKRQRIAETLRQEKLDAAAIAAPDSICWLLNIRGDDVATMPVTLAFALIDADGGVGLFTDLEKVGDGLEAHLGNGVWVAPWEAFDEALAAQKGRRVAVDKARAPAAIAQKLEAGGAERVWRADPCLWPKARKNAVEIEGARQAQRRDGAALSAFLAWVDRALPNPAIDELAVSKRLRQFRVETAERLGQPMTDDSFEAIVGFRGHAALPHYRVSPQSSSAIDGDGVLLVDSGGQYRDGTTDVTRTMAIGGAPSRDQIRAATAVMQGVIAISELRFPAKTKGAAIDGFARRALWRAGLDFEHGVGHGVGSFLGVHEGPASISKRGEVALEAGMILSNEPGYYRGGEFGVRLENLIVATEAETPEGGERPMHHFETLTLAPFDRRLLDPGLMTAEERAWLDAYHARVLAEIGPLIDPDARPWLEAACAPL